MTINQRIKNCALFKKASQEFATYPKMKGFFLAMHDNCTHDGDEIMPTVESAN